MQKTEYIKGKIVRISPMMAKKILKRERAVDIELTKKEIEKNKMLTFLFLICMGIGLFLPFGLRTYKLIKGLSLIENPEKKQNKKNGFEWIIAGFIFALLHAILSLFSGRMRLPLIVRQVKPYKKRVRRTKKEIEEARARENNIEIEEDYELDDQIDDEELVEEL